MSGYDQRNHDFSKAMTDAQVSYIEAERRVVDLEAENAKLRSTLMALVVGTNAELCADRDYPDCKECSMNRDRENCTITDAMELLGCDAYGEPMEVEDKKSELLA